MYKKRLVQAGQSSINITSRLREVIVQNALRLHSKAVKQFVDGSDHHRRSAHKVLDVLRSVVVLEIGLVHHIVNETCRVLDSSGVSCRIRTVKGQMEVEVRELLLDLGVVLKVECLDKAARSIEECTSRFVLRVLNRCMIWLLKGAIPAPPPTKIYS